MIQIKKAKPMFNRIITTCNEYPQHRALKGIEVVQHTYVKEYQTVISVGNTVKNINVGDVVIIDPTRYIKRKHQDGSLKDGIITDNPVTKIEYPIIEIDGNECLLLFDSDIIYIAEEFEEIPDEVREEIVIPKKTLIV